MPRPVSDVASSRLRAAAACSGVAARRELLGERPPPDDLAVVRRARRRRADRRAPATPPPAPQRRAAPAGADAAASDDATTADSARPHLTATVARCPSARSTCSHHARNAAYSPASMRVFASVTVVFTWSALAVARHVDRVRAERARSPSTTRARSSPSRPAAGARVQSSSCVHCAYRRTSSLRARERRVVADHVLLAPDRDARARRPRARANCGTFPRTRRRHPLLDVLEVAGVDRRHLAAGEQRPRSSAARAACASTRRGSARATRTPRRPLTASRHSTCAAPSAASVASTLCDADARASPADRAGARASALPSLTCIASAPRSIAGQLERARCTRPCRRGRGRATARTRSRDRTARGSPGVVSMSPLFAGAHDDERRLDAERAEHRDDERRLVFAVAEAAREDLRAPVRLEAVDPELERHVARLLDDVVVDRARPSRGRP